MSDPTPDPDLPDPMVLETRSSTERSPLTRREKVAGAIAAAAVAIAGVVGVVVTSGTSDTDRLNAVQACLDAGTRQRVTLACVTDAMEGYEVASPSPSPSPSPTPPPPPPCAGIPVAPGQSLSTIAAAAPAGTTFCLAAGVVNLSESVQMQTGDVVQGLPCIQDATSLEVTCLSKVAWTGNDSSLAMFVGQGHFSVFDLEVYGALGNGTCNPDCGRAFKPNQGMTAARLDCHDTDNQCIGSGGQAVVVSDSELWNNGIDPAFNNEDARSAGGIKRVRGGSLSVTHSYLHDNQWNALWCDYCESTFVVEDNIIVLNDASGIAWEVSGGWNDLDNAVIRNNVIQGNNIGGHRAKSGLTCNGCADLLIEGNTFGGNQGIAVHLLNTKRGPWGDLRNIVIRGNDLGGDSIIGCSLPGVTCEANT